jgi:hypothetical protein
LKGVYLHIFFLWKLILAYQTFKSGSSGSVILLRLILFSPSWSEHAIIYKKLLTKRTNLIKKSKEDQEWWINHYKSFDLGIKVIRSYLCSLRSLFLGCSSLSNLAIPNSVVEIGIGCSINCLSLQNFTTFLQNIPRVQNRKTTRYNLFITKQVLISLLNIYFILLRYCFKLKKKFFRFQKKSNSQFILYLSQLFGSGLNSFQLWIISFNEENFIYKSEGKYLSHLRLS